MFATKIDVSGFVALTKRQAIELPKSTAFALNSAMFGVRTGWQEAIGSVFDRPTPFTRNAVLYKKATPEHLVAEVFIKDDVSSGNPPARYLQAEVLGGARRQKAFEKLLQRNPRSRKYYVPGKGVKLDAFGNIPASTIGKILSQLQSRFVSENNETPTSRGRRLRRQRKRGGGGSYFVLAADRGKLRAGTVYERVDTAFGSAVRSVLVGVDKAPQYRIRFNANALAQRLFSNAFRKEFSKGFQRVLRLR